jgi:hypothetical protein
VADTIPHAAGRLITVSPYMSKLLAVIALWQAILVFVCLHLGRYMTKSHHFKDILGLLSPGKGYEEEGKVRFFRKKIQ